MRKFLMTPPALLVILMLLTPALSAAGQADYKKIRSGKSDTLVLRRVPISDKNGWIGGYAGSLLAPAKWQVQANVEWYYHPTMPGRIVFQTASPDGRDRIKMYPHLTFFYGPTVVPMQEGRSNYYGNIYLRPIGNATSLIEQIVLPWIYPDLPYQIIGAEPLPAYAKTVSDMNSGPGVRSHADSRRVRIRYQQDGRQVTEDVTSVYAVQQVGPVAYWQAQFVMTAASDARHIDAVNRIHAAMINSIQIDLQWFNKYLQICESFQRLAASNVQLAANQSRIISQLSDYVTENRRQVYENIQKSFERVNRNFSQSIRGVETWQNSHGESFELPSGYNQGWQSDDGTILVTSNPNFNPGTDPAHKNKNWHKLEKPAL